MRRAAHSLSTALARFTGPTDNAPMTTPRCPSLALALAFSAALACADDGSGDDEVAEGEETQADAGSDDSTDTGETGGEACPNDTPAQLAACVEEQRYLDDLSFIAQPREPGSAHWQAVQDLCFERFTEYGFEVDLHEYQSGVNVLGRKLGTEFPEQQIVVAAHYDHIPGCNGADDNASGTAAVLEAARVLSMRDYPRTLLVACWDEEELGLIGAEAYVDLAANAGDEILFNYNYEMIAFSDPAPNSQTVPDGIDLVFPEAYATLTDWEFRGDWIGLIVDESGLEHAQAMEAHATALGLDSLILNVPADLKSSPLLSDLRRSDHAAFWDQDYPAMMITDTSEFRYANYHCASGEDAVELLDHGFATKVIGASVGAAAESLGLE